MDHLWTKPHPIYKQLLIIVAFLASYLMLFSFLEHQHHDTKEYVQAIHYLAGTSDTPDEAYRLSKPLGLIFPLILYKLGIDVVMALKIQSVLLTMLSALLMYQLAMKLLKNARSALLVLIAFMGCQVLGVYGIAALTDIWGHFLNLLIVVLILYSSRLEHLLLAGLIAGLGMYAKENVAVGILISYALIIPLKWDFFKSKHLWAFTLGLAPVFLILWFMIDQSFGINLGMRLEQQHDMRGFIWYDFHSIKQAYRSLDLLWPLVLFGGYQFWKQGQGENLRRISVAVIISGLALPLYPWIHDRIIFSASLFLIPLIMSGMKFSFQWKLRLVLLASIASLSISSIVYRTNQSGVLIASLMAFILIYAGISFVTSRAVK